MAKEMSKLPSVSGTIYRGNTGKYKYLSKGEIIDALPINSSTWSKKGALGFVYGRHRKQIFEITTNDGKDISKYSRRPEEQEVVLLGGKFKITSIRNLKNTDGRYELIKMEHIPSDKIKTKSQLRKMWDKTK